MNYYVYIKIDIIVGPLEGPFLRPKISWAFQRENVMTKYDAALQEAELEFRPMTLIVWKAGLLIRLRTENM